MKSLISDFYSGESPLVNADVVATVRAADSVEEFELMPRDDGATPDVYEDDGVYSAYFVDFAAMGRYGVEVKLAWR